LTKANLSEVTGFDEAFLDRTILTGALLPPRSPRQWRAFVLHMGFAT
jgi:hypothetical protein